MASFADFQYCIYADIMGGCGSEKVQNYADVIYGWFPCPIVIFLRDFSDE